MAPEASSIIRPAIEESAEAMAKAHIDQIEKLKTEAGKFKEMLSDIFTNDPTYQTHDAACKEALKVRNNTKKQILKLPQAADLINKITNLREQIKEGAEQLSLFLDDYQKETGSTVIEDNSGSVRRIVKVLKVSTK